jgi:hypothetical protein
MALTLDTRVAHEHITGLGTFEILAFNPTKKQLAELGIEKDTDKKYIELVEGDVPQPDGSIKKESYRRMNLNVLVKNTDNYVERKSVVDGKLKIEIIPNPCMNKIYRTFITLDNTPRVSLKKTTDENGMEIKQFKQQFLNGVGSSIWSPRLSAIKDLKSKKGKNYGEGFLKNEPVYPALAGASTLYEFLQAWTGIDKFNESSKIMLGKAPEDLAQIFEKEQSEIIKELNGYVKLCEGFTLKMLIGVDGTYSKVYSREFLSAYVDKKSINTFMERAADKWGFNADYQNTHTLKLYQPLFVAPQSDDVVSNDDVEVGSDLEMDNGLGLDTDLGLGTDINTDVIDDDMPF